MVSKGWKIFTYFFHPLEKQTSGFVILYGHFFFKFQNSSFRAHGLYFPAMSSHNYWNTLYRYTAIAVFVLAVIGIVFAFMPKVTQFHEYQETKSTLGVDLCAEEERIKELRNNQERFHTDKYFVQQIGHQIGFAHEGEVIFQFDDGPTTNIQNKSRPAQ